MTTPPPELSFAWTASWHRAAAILSKPGAGMEAGQTSALLQPGSSRLYRSDASGGSAVRQLGIPSCASQRRVTASARSCRKSAWFPPASRTSLSLSLRRTRTVPVIEPHFQWPAPVYRANIRRAARQWKGTASTGRIATCPPALPVDFTLLHTYISVRCFFPIT